MSYFYNVFHICWPIKKYYINSSLSVINTSFKTFLKSKSQFLFITKISVSKSKGQINHDFLEITYLIYSPCILAKCGGIALPIICANNDFEK